MENKVDVSTRQFVERHVVKEGMSYAEAGRQLGVSRQAVHKHVKKIRGQK